MLVKIAGGEGCNSRVREEFLKKIICTSGGYLQQLLLMGNSHA